MAGTSQRNDLAKANDSHRNGRVGEAIRLYRKVLQREPDNAAALNLLGIACFQQGDLKQAAASLQRAFALRSDLVGINYNLGIVFQALHRYDEAIQHFQKSVTSNPNDVEALNSLGAVLNANNRSAEAEQCLRRAIGLNPNYAEAHMGLANVLRTIGRPDEAIACYEAAILLKPRLAEAHLQLGETLQALGRHEKATRSYELVLSFRPDSAEAHMNLGNALQALGHHEKAIRSYEKALLIKPGYAKAHYNLGNALQSLDRHDEAISCYQRALALEPRYPNAHTNLGNSLQARGHYEEAIHHCEQAIACAPDFTTARMNLANTLQAVNRCDEAMWQYDKAMALEPENAEVKWNRSLLLLSTGRFSEGWNAYESRWAGGMKGNVPRRYIQQRWSGEYVEGVLLAWAEQGLGDHILYSSMMPELCARASSLVLEVEPRLVTLFSRSFPGVQVIGLGSELHGGRIDAQTPLASAGTFLRESWDSFPRREHGYLSADKVRADTLRRRLTRGQRIVIGISWRSQHPLFGKSKSARLIDFEPILRMRGCRVVDLQYGDTSEECRAAEQELGAKIERLTDVDNTNDIDGLAALISACDLVVTVSNTTAHLAGALGKPTWVLVPHGNARIWYWFRDKAQSPWYSRTHVRHQSRGQSWAALVSSIAGEVSRFGRPVEDRLSGVEPPS